LTNAILNRTQPMRQVRPRPCPCTRSRSLMQPRGINAKGYLEGRAPKIDAQQTADVVSKACPSLVTVTRKNLNPTTRWSASCARPTPWGGRWAIGPSGWKAAFRPARAASLSARSPREIECTREADRDRPPLAFAPASDVTAILSALPYSTPERIVTLRNRHVTVTLW
jgi:hypothetical protein